MDVLPKLKLPRPLIQAYHAFSTGIKKFFLPKQVKEIEEICVKRKIGTFCFKQICSCAFTSSQSLFFMV